MNDIFMGTLSRSLFGHLIAHYSPALGNLYGTSIALLIQSFDPSLSAQLNLLQAGKMGIYARCT